MRAVVTGANGHLGGTLCRLLSEQGHQLRACIRLPHTRERLWHSPNHGYAETVKYELNDLSSLMRAFERAEVVFHTAAPTELWSKKSSDITQPIYDGTQNVIRAAAAAGVGHVVYTSSCAAIGFEASNDRDLNENDYNWMTEHPQFRAKMRSELDGAILAKELGVVFTRVCPPSVLGPEFRKSSPSTKPYELLVRGQMRAIPNLSYHIVDVRDLALAQILLADRIPNSDRYIVAGEYVTPEHLLHLLRGIDQDLRLPRFVLPRFALSATAFIDKGIHALSFGTTTRRLTFDLVRECGGCNQRVTSDKFRQEFPQWTSRPLSETLRDTLEWILGNRNDLH